MWRHGLALLLPALLLLAACVERPAPPERLSLSPTRFEVLPGWDEGRQGEAVPAFQRSCRLVLGQKVGEAAGPPDFGALDFGGPDFGGTAADWRAPCEAAMALGGGAAFDALAFDILARDFFERWFVPFEMSNGGERRGLFTGYFEPELPGALVSGGRYTVPLYARPPDLVSVDLGAFRAEFEGITIAGRVVDGSLRPLESRAEIDQGALEGRDLELVWVDDPIDAFFLQIQGSGRILFEDGSSRRIGYAASNGHAYVAIGRELIARGELAPETVSLQTIRAWLEAHPGQAAALLALNPSYIFFRWLPGDGSEPGPLGAQGVSLTPGRSLAVDRRFVPLGAPLWLDASAPSPSAGEPERPLRRLVIAQDSGSAIRGPVRGDLFWGAGADALSIAGRMKSWGVAYLLLPAAIAERMARAGP